MAELNLAFLSLLLLVPLFILFLAVIVRPRPVKVPIKGRHVFITGSSSGIGLALAHGAAAKLVEAQQAIRLATGVDAAIFAADVRDFDVVQEAIEAAGPTE